MEHAKEMGHGKQNSGSYSSSYSSDASPAAGVPSIPPPSHARNDVEMDVMPKHAPSSKPAETQPRLRAHGARTSNSFRALVRKNASMQLAQRKTNICQICTPVVMVSLVGIMSLIINALIKAPTVDPNNIINLPPEEYTFPPRGPTAVVNLIPTSPSSTVVGERFRDGSGYGMLAWAPFSDINNASGQVEYSAPNTRGFASADAADLALATQFADEANRVEAFERATGYSIKDVTKTLHQGCPDYSGESSPDTFLAQCTPAQREVFLFQLAQEKRVIPAGLIFDNVLNGTDNALEYTIQGGNLVDPDNTNAFRINDAVPSWERAGRKFAYYVYMIHNAFIRFTLSPDARLIAPFKPLPEREYDDSADFDAVAFLSSLLFPFATSFLLPVFVYTPLYEKESRLRGLMAMMGLSSRVYWAVNYVYDYILHTLSCAAFIGIGLVWQIPFFLRTPPLIYIGVLFLWGHAQIGLAFVMAVVFRKSRPAVVISYLVIVLSVAVAQNINNLLYAPPKRASVVMLGVWPLFAYYRCLFLIAQSISRDAPMTLSGVLRHSLSKSSTYEYEVGTAAGCLLFQALVLLGIAAYLDNVLPQQFGVPKSLCFCCRPMVARCRRQWHDAGDDEEDARAGHGALLGDDDLADLLEQEEGEDDDVLREREYVQSLLSATGPGIDDHAVVVSNIRKRYANGKGANKSLTFAIRHGETFGLLGANGAGKSTLISILTGLYPPSSGKAWIAGHDITTSMDAVHHAIGVCPQHDTLWDQLTVRQHLLFYARVKGVPAADEAAHVEENMALLGLEPFANRKASQLSGGMQRRLSVAIAATGDSVVVFLDEPSSGVDPATRQDLWAAITKLQDQGRCIVLTTHALEEADTLSTRIGIMTKGRMRVVGTNDHLKARYGGGVKIELACVDEAVTEPAKALVAELLPSAQLISEFAGRLAFEVDKASVRVSTLFAAFEARKVDAGVRDWGISTTSLDDVFLRVVTEDEADDS